MNKEKTNDTHCEYNDKFKRVRYSHGMLLTKADFQDEQTYHNNKRKLLNRMFHGWGVVCGLKITPTEKKTSKENEKSKEEERPSITIEPGFALDCEGNEILVCESYIFEPKFCTLTQTTQTNEQCEDKQKGKGGAQENKWYVVIKYNEVPIDLEPVYTPGGGCEEKKCEHSRMREGFCIELSQKGCPDKEVSKSDNICNDLLYSCTPCACCDKQVVLGSITYNKGTKTIKINNWDCRRYVITHGLLDHWMQTFAAHGQTVTIDQIMKYAQWAKKCKEKGTLTFGNSKPAAGVDVRIESSSLSGESASLPQKRSRTESHKAKKYTSGAGGKK